MNRRPRLGLLVLTAMLVSGPAVAEEQTAAQRGRDALFGRCFSHPVVSRRGYDNVWKQWGVAEKPADLAAAVRPRYGLHAAPYPNGDLPMGLRPARSLLGTGVGLDCMLCHAGSLFGQPYVGLPNTSLDLQSLFEDLAASDGLPKQMPYRLSNVRGTTEATATAIFLIAFRDPDLRVRPPADLGPVPDQMCEDAPAWWLLKKKKTMYHNGQIDARAVRPLTSFMMSPLTSGATFKKLEPVFADIKAFLLTLEAPKYPFPVDAALAECGRKVFEATCSRCHGTYGPDGSYPSKIVPLEVVGTDATLVRGITPRVEEHYRKSWFAQEPGPDGKPYPIRYNQGYQAPPLDGVWATAPYFHNGSVPTLYHVLNSKSRPKVHTRSYRTAKEDFDAVRVGWKVTATEGAAQGRRVYDTSQPGRGNGGHPFGDRLSEQERMAVIEYLKTL